MFAHNTNIKIWSYHLARFDSSKKVGKLSVKAQFGKKEEFDGVFTGDTIHNLKRRKFTSSDAIVILTPTPQNNITVSNMI